MVKKLLMMLAVATVATAAKAYDLPLEDLASGWNSQYDPATHTITYESSWSGRGWWLDDVNFSMFDKVVVEMEPATITAQLIVEYNNDMASSSSGLCSLGDASLTVMLDPAAKASVKQIYIQCGDITDSPTIVIKSAKLEAAQAGEEGTLWEGTYTATGWNAGATVQQSQLKAGDVLFYYMTPGDASAQVIMKGADWSNLVGSSKIVNSSIIDGIVQVLVTQEMLDNCGGQIFLQGDGGITCTKVQKVAEIGTIPGVDLNILNAGTRMLPAEAFIHIPDDAASITLIFTNQPSWLQICDKNWQPLITNDYAMVMEDEGFVLMTFPMTDDIKAAINAENQMVMNGDENAAYIAAIVMNGTPSIEPLYTVGLTDNTSSWWTAWSPTYAITGDGTIEFEFINYSNMAENWNNWLAVMVNADVNPAQEGYTSANELLVVRCDNYGWGQLIDNTTFENNYDWDNFKTDMNGSIVSMVITRSGDIVTLDAEIVTAGGDEYSYITTTTGVTSDVLGVFLTTEFGHLDVYDVAINGVSGIRDITAATTAEKHFYNLNGIEIPATSLTPGLYIVKQGDKTSKVIVR